MNVVIVIAQVLRKLSAGLKPATRLFRMVFERLYGQNKALREGDTDDCAASIVV